MTTATLTKKTATKKASVKKRVAKNAGAEKTPAKRSTAKRTTARRGAARKERSYPGAVVTLDGREYFLVSREEFEEWDEDLQFAALVAERMAEIDDDELIPAEDVDRYFEDLKKKRS